MELLGAEMEGAPVRCWRGMDLGKHAIHQSHFMEGPVAHFTCCSQLFFVYFSKVLAGQFSFEFYIRILRNVSFVSAPRSLLLLQQGSLLKQGQRRVMEWPSLRHPSWRADKELVGFGGERKMSWSREREIKGWT